MHSIPVSGGIVVLVIDELGGCVGAANWDHPCGYDFGSDLP